METPKPLLSLAGEYAVASQLSRMGMYAQLTFGNQKKTDILVKNPETNKMVIIEVKAKQKGDFPSCKGVKGKDAFLVLVDFKDKNLGEKPEETPEMPDFYILSDEDWLKFVKAQMDKHPISKYPKWNIEIDDDNCPVWIKKICNNGKPYRGMGIKPKQVIANKNRWDLIKEASNSSP